MEAIQFLLRHVTWVWPTVLIGGGFVSGFLLEKWMIRKLRKLAEKSPNHIPQIMIHTLRGILTLWLLIAGIYWAIPSFPLSHNLIVGLQKTLAIFVLWSATITVARIAEGSIRFYAEQQRGKPQSTSIIVNIARGLVIGLGGLFLLQTLGISITPILTALGVGGLAVALAMQDTLSNLFSGVHLILSRYIRPGDYIQLNSGEEGYVRDINWRNTVLRTLPDNLIIIPNSKLATANITNYNFPRKEMSVVIQMSVAYGSDLEHVEKIIIEEAIRAQKEVEGAVEGFEPFVRFHTFADSGVGFSVILRVKEFVEQHTVKHFFIKTVHARFKKEKIEIPYPTRHVIMQTVS